MTAVRRVVRVVMDTNIVLSALVFAQGRLVPLRQAWQQGRCRPLVSATTTAELMRALRYPKFKLSLAEQEELLADYLPYCATVRMPAKLPKTPPCRDPFDIPFLQLALVGKADHLVTGDKDLLGLAGVFARSIITAEQLLGLLDKD
jgi:putative PIN family toxin of toxin-antitoxin system